MVCCGFYVLSTTAHFTAMKHLKSDTEIVFMFKAG